MTASATDVRADGSPPAELTAEQAADTMRSKQFVGLLAIVAVIGVLVSVAAWCFLELIYQLQRELFTHLPHALGYDNGPPLWSYLPVLGIGGLLVAVLAGGEPDRCRPRDRLSRRREQKR